MSSRCFSRRSVGELYRRIDARFDAMLAAGALEEVRALHARRLDPLLPAMKAHGVPWLIRHLEGEMSLDGRRGTGQARHPPLCQAPVHLVPPPARRLAPGRSSRRIRRRHARRGPLRDEPKAPPGRRGREPRDQHPPGRPQPIGDIQIGGEDAQGIDAGRGGVPGDLRERRQDAACRGEADQPRAA